MAKNIKSGNKTGIILSIVIIILVVFYSVVVIVAPIRKMTELKKQVYSDTVFYKKNKSSLQYRNLFELQKTKALKEAELKLAQKDTFGLVVNLNDSTMKLMFKGVTIHSAKIFTYEKDRFFNSLDPLVYAKLFSKPLRTQSEFTTIVKEPIIIKKAPKDTIEAMTNAHMPDTLVQDPAYIRFELEHGINLLMVQRDLSTPEGKTVEKLYKSDINRRKNSDIIANFTHLQKGSYTPFLVLYLNPDEIRSAYRALPEDALVILSY